MFNYTVVADEFCVEYAEDLLRLIAVFDLFLNCFIFSFTSWVIANFK